MLLTLELRPKQPAFRLSLAVVTRHHLLFLLLTRAITASAGSPSASSPIITTSGSWASSPHSATGSGSGADPASRVTSVPGSATSEASPRRDILRLPRARRPTINRHPREEHCEPGLVMLGYGTPALGRRGAKEVLWRWALSSALMDVCCSTTIERA
eukprot:360701-Chlamydomonas_euryale.AAC.2